MKTALRPPLAAQRPRALKAHYTGRIEQPFDLPDSEETPADLDEPSDLYEPADPHHDDSVWDVFLPDDDFDDEPDPNDFDSLYDDARNDE